jgi:DNA-binding MarR family transcriptional regulator
MADINPQLVARRGTPTVPTSPPASAAEPLPAANPHLIAFVELMFFAYRDFTREADAILAGYRLGRAHHRVLHFVNRHPGLRVADLLDILKITKQSLARVLKQLVDEGWISQRCGERDRRQRLLLVTEKGARLAAHLDGVQSRRVARALAAAGRDEEVIARFLFAVIAAEERPPVKALLPVRAGARGDRD